MLFLDERRQPTFREQLKKISFENDIPWYCEDPISYKLMNQPIMLNDFEPHTLDKKTLEKILKRDKKNPFNNGPIYSMKDNLLRKEKISQFVWGLTHIFLLEKKQTDEINKIKSEFKKADMSLSILQFSPFLRKKILQDQEQEALLKSEVLMMNNISLREALQSFIQATLTHILNFDDSEFDRAKEIKEVLEPYQKKLRAVNQKLLETQYHINHPHEKTMQDLVNELNHPKIFFKLRPFGFFPNRPEVNDAQITGPIPTLKMGKLD